MAYVERDAYCAATLVARMEEEVMARAPIWDDLTTFPCKTFRGAVDWLCAGFPCQPVSCAGKQLAQADERWLWPHIARIIGEVGPRYILLENVPGLLIQGLGDVLGSLAELGFDAEWCRVGAYEVGAPHRRRRIFILAYGDGGGRGGQRVGGILNGERTTRGNDADGRDAELGDTESPRCDGTSGAWAYDEGKARPRLRGKKLGDTDGTRLEGRGLQGRERAYERAPWPPGPADSDGWREYLERFPGLEPAIRRGPHGIPNRVERLRALGNAVCAPQAELALRLLIDRSPLVGKR